MKPKWLDTHAPPKAQSAEVLQGANPFKEMLWVDCDIFPCIPTIEEMYGGKYTSKVCTTWLCTCRTTIETFDSTKAIPRRTARKETCSFMVRWNTGTNNTV